MITEPSPTKGDKARQSAGAPLTLNEAVMSERSVLKRSIDVFRAVHRVALGVVVAAPLMTSAQVAVAQQGEWLNPDVIALRDEVARLQAEVAALRGGGALGGGALGDAGGASVGGDVYFRLGQIENELRTMTGRIEELEFRLTQGQLQQSRQIENLRFRMDALEGGAPVAGAAGIGAAGLGGVNPGGVNAGGVNTGGGDLGVDIGGGQTATLNQGDLGVDIGGAPAAGGAAVLDPTPGRGAPPQILGTIPGDAGGAAAPRTNDQIAAAGGQVGGAQIGAGQVGAGQIGAGAAVPIGDPQQVYQRAVDTLRSGDFLNARSQLKTFITAYPQDPLAGDANYWLGETFYVRGQYDEAAQTFSSGVQNYPEARKAPDNLMKLGMTLAQLGEAGQACLTFSEVPARYPNADQSVLRRTEIEARRAGCR